MRSSISTSRPSAVAAVVTSLLVSGPAAAEHQPQPAERPEQALSVLRTFDTLKSGLSQTMEGTAPYKVGEALLKQGAPISWENYATALGRAGENRALEMLLVSPLRWDIQYEVAKGILGALESERNLVSESNVKLAKSVSTNLIRGNLIIDCDRFSNVNISSDNRSSFVLSAALTPKVTVYTQNGEVFRQVEGPGFNFAVQPGSQSSVSIDRLAGIKIPQDGRDVEVTVTGEVLFTDPVTHELIVKESVNSKIFHRAAQVDRDPYDGIYYRQEMGPDQASYFGAVLFMDRARDAIGAVERGAARLPDTFKPTPRPMHPLVKTHFPDLKVFAENGEAITLPPNLFASQEYTVVEFGFPGCGHCIEGIPELTRVHARPDVNVIYLVGQIFVDGVEQTRKEFNRRVGLSQDRRGEPRTSLPFPVYILGKGDEQKFQTNIAPTFMIINREGTVVAILEGGHLSLEAFEEAISNVK